MPKCPTVAIKSGERYAIINESDFDPDVHELFEGEVTPPVDPAPEGGAGDEPGGEAGASSDGGGAHTGEAGEIVPLTPKEVHKMNKEALLSALLFRGIDGGTKNVPELKSTLITHITENENEKE